MKKVLKLKSAIPKLPKGIQPSGESVASNRVNLITLGAMCLTLFMINFDSTVVEVALPQIQAGIGADLMGLQWILNAYNLPVMSLFLTCGTLGDTYGRKRVFLSGLVLFTLSSILCSITPNLESLLVGRTFQGIGAAALIPLSLTILTTTYPEPKERAKVIGIWSGVSALAFLAGPVLGGLFVDILGWQSMFLFNVPLAMVTHRLTDCFVQESRNPEKKPLDLPGLILSISMLTSLTFLLTEGSAGDWLSPHIFALLGITGLSFLGFCVVESRSRYPMLPLQLFESSKFAIANIIPILVFFTSSSLLFVFSLFFQQVQGYSAAAAGLRFIPMNAAIILASFISGWVASRLGWRFPILSGLTMASISVFALTQINATADYSEILWTLVLSGFGGGLTIAPLAAVTMNSVLPVQEGIASAIFNVSIYLGSILGIALQGTVLAQHFALNLKQSLDTWAIPSNLQDQLINDALHGGSKVPSLLPNTISALAFQKAFNDAFVSGLHAVVLVASLAILSGLLLIVAHVLLPVNAINNFANAVILRNRVKE